ncbi:MAG: hypothetical protein ACFCVB_07125 [Nodosilinea sp.]
MQWASISTVDSKGQSNHVVKRATAVAIATAKASVGASTIARAIANDSDSVRDSVSAKGIITTRAIASAIAVASKSINDSDSDTISNAIIAIARAIASDSDSTKSSLFDAIFSNSKFIELPNQLEHMAKTLPTNDAPCSTWQNWANELETLWLDALGLSRADLIFNREEAKALQNYLYAIDLLLRCKDAAIRIPKQAWAELEDRLLTYPS